MDASIKIYAHRVDDTYATSHRILESLSRNNNGSGEDGQELNSDGTRRVARVGSKAASSRLNISDTIERNVDHINASKVENDAFVDPMFHKMSQAFDEGGAKGMLMANLVTFL